MKKSNNRTQWLVLEALKHIRAHDVMLAVGCSLPSVYKWKEGNSEAIDVYRSRLEDLVRNLRRTVGRARPSRGAEPRVPGSG